MYEFEQSQWGCLFVGLFICGVVCVCAREAMIGQRFGNQSGQLESSVQTSAAISNGFAFGVHQYRANNIAKI